MKSLRLERVARSLQKRGILHTQSTTVTTTRRPRRELQTRHRHLHQRTTTTQWQQQQRRNASTAAEPVQREEKEKEEDDFIPDTSGLKDTTYAASLNFPPHTRASRSAKLAALHARLSLPTKLPLLTLARCLVDPSVDPRSGYNNAPLAILGQELLGYYTTEWLICKYPRLPMAIIQAAAYAYLGNATLNSVRLEWGVEAVAAPGPEVDPGLLQLKRLTPGNAMSEDGMTRVKDATQQERKFSKYSSSVVHDDMFGEAQELPAFDIRPYAGAPTSVGSSESTNTEMADSIGAGIQGEMEADMGRLPLQPFNNDTIDANSASPVTLENASAAFVRALAGALYLHAGTQAVKDFHKAHILSRHLPLHTMFNFKSPTQDLSKLCRREGWEAPVARLISETGRLSRTPVFIVGVFSGNDKLGEGAGSSLNEGRVRAAADALRSWYLYSPMENQIVLPSEVEGQEGRGKKWVKQFVDMGEIVA